MDKAPIYYNTMIFHKLFFLFVKNRGKSNEE